jgi:hypothetical protein
MQFDGRRVLTAAALELLAKLGAVHCIPQLGHIGRGKGEEDLHARSGGAGLCVAIEGLDNPERPIFDPPRIGVATLIKVDTGECAAIIQGGELNADAPHAEGLG